MRLPPVLLLAVALALPTLAHAQGAPALPGPGPAVEVRPLLLLPVPSVNRLEEAVAADSEVLQIQQGVEKRLRLLKVHRALGIASAVTMFTAQSFGLVNRIALGQGVKRDELEPTLMLHRVFVGSSLVTYFGAGAVAIGMPGPGGDRASKALLGGPRVLRNVHIGLSIAHAIALAVAGTTGVLQAYVARDTSAWEPLVTTHQIAASTAAGLMLTAAFVVK
jgi:hypothetical protein